LELVKGFLHKVDFLLVHLKIFLQLCLVVFFYIEVGKRAPDLWMIVIFTSVGATFIHLPYHLLVRLLVALLLEKVHPRRLLRGRHPPKVIP